MITSVRGFVSAAWRRAVAVLAPWSRPPDVDPERDARLIRRRLEGRVSPHVLKDIGGDGAP